MGDGSSEAEMEVTVDDGSTLGGETLELEPKTLWDRAQGVNACRTVVDKNQEGKVIQVLAMVGGVEMAQGTVRMPRGSSM